MNATETIMVARVKSNRSENYVWAVFTKEMKTQHCKNAASALRLAFLLKKQTGRPIARKAMDLLKSEIMQTKTQNVESAEGAA